VRHVETQALESLVDSLDRDGALAGAPLRVTRADGVTRDCLVSADTLRVGDAVQVFCVVRDITEQLQHDAALRAGYDMLRAQLHEAQSAAAAARAGQLQAETALQEFTRAVAHDLRSPLHAVQGFVGLLRMRLQEGHVQEALEYSEHIERAARRMTSMVAALSGLAQVSRAPLQRQAVDMARLAHDSWSLIAATQPQRRVECRIGELPPAQAEPDLVAQIWQNLLDNAWKYSARVADARVAVDSFRDARGTWYRVTDNGAGFDMARAMKLFVPFQRMHSEGQFPGTGVGLSLVKRIVDHHGGDIRVRSTPGVGTIVEFTLDAAP
jgi:signal transduction histidine kinase